MLNLPGIPRINLFPDDLFIYVYSAVFTDVGLHHRMDRSFISPFDANCFSGREQLVLAALSHLASKDILDRHPALRDGNGLGEERVERLTTDLISVYFFRFSHAFIRSVMLILSVPSLSLEKCKQ